MKAETIVNYLIQTLDKQTLTSKFIEFTGDNANVNFGDITENLTII